MIIVWTVNPIIWQSNNIVVVVLIFKDLDLKHSQQCTSNPSQISIKFTYNII